MRHRRTTPHENAEVILRLERFQKNASWYQDLQAVAGLEVLNSNQHPVRSACGDDDGDLREKSHYVHHPDFVHQLHDQ